MVGLLVAILLGFVLLVAIAAASQTDAKGASPAKPASQAPAQTAFPLAQWRGMGKMTRNHAVFAACRRCGNQWRLDSKVSNTIAQEQGLGSRLQKTGLKLEQTGATFTLGASGRRIAAGNELDRANTALANLYSLAACPSCGSWDVLLSKEPHRAPRSTEKPASRAAERGPKAETVKGECPVCRRQVRLTAKKGLVGTHVTGGVRCVGMGRSPVEVTGGDASDGGVSLS